MRNDDPVAPALLAQLQQRRLRLAALFPKPVVLWAGRAPARNFAANRFPFRASSHFLYFVGLPLSGAIAYLHGGALTLFWDAPPDLDTLWHGSGPTTDWLADAVGAGAVYPTAMVSQVIGDAASIPIPDAVSQQHQSQVLGRSLSGRQPPMADDRQLAEAIIQLRLVHDDSAIAGIRAAASVTVQAHRAGMAHTRQAQREAEVRAAMEAVIIGQDWTTAYASIVTVAGNILHNMSYHRPLQSGDLLLADVGAEHPGGWAADVTRTWPVSGVWSTTQQAIYEVVLAAHDAAIAQLGVGVEFREVHLRAAHVLTEGLVQLGILRGDPEALVARDAHALFFPHGIGHLLGLDVHDMEDLGDLAGYAPGRTRSDRFGLSYLRLDRPLQAGMCVTIEPGFYQVPAILQDPERRSRYDGCVNWGRLADFSDVRGIRIEDDVYLTPNGCEVLTAALPTAPAEILGCIRSKHHESGSRNRVDACAEIFCT